jgi:hypothetical protein
MKNITIGLVGPDWKPAESALYYASRGDGEEYAFGVTPSEALSNLEKREASVLKSIEEDVFDDIAFLALGAASYLRKNNLDTDLSFIGGYMGLIRKVISYAPLLAQRWNKIGADGFDGVWLYDVTRRFGHDLAEAFLAKNDADPASILNLIISYELKKIE